MTLELLRAEFCLIEKVIDDNERWKEHIELEAKNPTSDPARDGDMSSFRGLVGSLISTVPLI